MGKKQAKKFSDVYYGSGTMVKKWKSKGYILEHWPICWADDYQQLLEKEYEFVRKGMEFVDCVNRTSGGSPAMSGKKHSPETIQKMKESASQVEHKPLTQEVKNKISESNKGKHSKSYEQRQAVGDFHSGRKRSEETCKKIGTSKRGKNNPNYGKQRSEETKKKISESQKGRKFTPEHIEKLRQSHRKPKENELKTIV